jgi:hypothetical protein
LATETDQLRSAQTRLDCYEQECPIAAPGPGALVRSCQQSFHLGSREEINRFAVMSLAGDGQNPLSQSPKSGLLKRDIPEKRVDSSQTNVAASRGVVSVFFQVVQKQADERRIQILGREQCRRLTEAILRKSQQQSKRVSVTGNRVRAGVPFGNQPLREVAMKQG